MSDSHWTDKPNPEFEQWWATKTAAGYQYGREALENVRFGFEGAQELRWQPIETAPRDGTPVLIAFPNGQVQQHVLKPLHVKVVWFPGGEEPTHWMPLPDPPSFDQGEVS